MRGPLRLPLEQLAPCLFAVPETPAPLDWHSVFGNNHPVEMEVGFGKGLFLLTAAQERPDVNFFGIEIERKYQLFTATRLVKRGLANVRLACTDARLFLRDFVQDGSVHALHVYFPDPWWKKRHHKRRLFNELFVAQVARVLKSGGHLHLLSDVAEYFAIMKELLAAQPRLQYQAPLGEKDEAFRTNFERKYRQEGRPIHGALYVKPPFAM